MLDCQLYGLKAGWHHFTNVLLHCIAVILLFIALQRMTGALWRSAFVAALFALHPSAGGGGGSGGEPKDVARGGFFLPPLLRYGPHDQAPWSCRYLSGA